MIVVIYYYEFCFQRATRGNTFHSNSFHHLKIKVIYICWRLLPTAKSFGNQRGIFKGLMIP